MLIQNLQMQIADTVFNKQSRYIIHDLLLYYNELKIIKNKEGNAGKSEGDREVSKK
jgi:hypothetical protein